MHIITCTLKSRQSGKIWWKESIMYYWCGVLQASGCVANCMEKEPWCGGTAAATRDSSGRMCTTAQDGWRFLQEVASLFMRAPGRMGSWRGRASSSEWWCLGVSGSVSRERCMLKDHPEELESLENWSWEWVVYNLCYWQYYWLFIYQYTFFYC